MIMRWLTRDQYVRHQALSYIKGLCMLRAYLSRHAIFNEQNDLDREDTISHDLLLLVTPLVSSIETDNERAFPRIAQVYTQHTTRRAHRGLLIYSKVIKRLHNSAGEMIAMRGQFARLSSSCESKYTSEYVRRDNFMYRMNCFIASATYSVIL